MKIRYLVLGAALLTGVGTMAYRNNRPEAPPPQRQSEAVEIIVPHKLSKAGKRADFDIVTIQPGAPAEAKTETPPVKEEPKQTPVKEVTKEEPKSPPVTPPVKEAKAPPLAKEQVLVVSPPPSLAPLAEGKTVAKGRIKPPIEQPFCIERDGTVRLLPLR